MEKHNRLIEIKTTINTFKFLKEVDRVSAVLIEIVFFSTSHNRILSFLWKREWSTIEQPNTLKRRRAKFKNLQYQMLRHYSYNYSVNSTGFHFLHTLTNTFYFFDGSLSTDSKWQVSHFLIYGRPFFENLAFLCEIAFVPLSNVNGSGALFCSTDLGVYHSASAMKMSAS